MGKVSIVYDGGCGICRRFKRFVELFDRKEQLEWRDLHDADYDALPVTEEDCLDAMQAIDDGTVYAGYEAVRRICRAVPVLLPLYLFFSIPGIRFAGHRVYRYVADHRHCAIPRPG